MLYESLDLTFQPDGRGAYRVHATCALAGDASGLFCPPRIEEAADPSDARDLAPACGGAQREGRSQVLGGALFDGVFTDGILQCLRESFERARKIDLGLRVRLRLTGCSRLSGLPWELLYDRYHDCFLAQSEETPVVRYLELPEPIEPMTIEPPLRILVAIASPRGLQPLDASGERNALLSALAGAKGLVSVEVLERATVAALAERLAAGRHHVLHFIGHGAFETEEEGGRLLFEDEAGGTAAVDGHRLATLLADHDDLRLVVLNACEGARSAEEDVLSGVAQSLVRRIPAVVAMRRPISDRAAVSFARSFYRGLARGLAVDSALAAARRRMYVQDGAPEWATPVLYMRSDGQLFHVEQRHRLPWWANAALASVSLLAVLLMVWNLSGGGQELAVAPLPSCLPSTVLPGLEMAQIPAGRFTMGGNRDDRKPPHEVALTRSFCLGRYEVTQRQFAAIMGYDPSVHQGEDLPVDNVSWGEAQAFIDKLNALELGGGYRLATEAEWEYAARGGAWGLSAADAKSANCESDAVNDGFDGPAPVGTFAPNPWGLYDMVGNVSEWVADWYAPSYPPVPQRDPTGPASGRQRVRRGGSFAITAAACTAVARNKSEPTRQAKDVGFRLARDVSPGLPAASR